MTAPARLHRSVAVALAAIVVGVLVASCDALPSPSPSVAGAVVPEPTLGAKIGPTASTPRPTAAAPSPTATDGVGMADIAIVPVVGFRRTWTSTDAAEVAAVIAGTSRRYAAIEVTEADSAAILARFGLATTGVGVADGIVIAADAAALAGDLATHDDRLGFLRADEVAPSVRAIAWEGVELFGGGRVRTLSAWPLLIRVLAAAGAAQRPAYDPATAWSLVAGGDVNLDGAIAYAVKNRGLGVDYPWDGGTARITAHYCCSYYGFEMARARRTGEARAVRALLTDADLAIVNLENPAPDDFTYHPAGFTFSADPTLLEGLRNAGIDWVSLANNHIRDAGGRGVVETIDNLDQWGIAHGGAGADLAAARDPSLLPVAGVTVAILAYDTIRPSYAAGTSRAGSNQMSAARVVEDVAGARAAGADLVIVFPHWGTEYTARPTTRQRTLAHAAIDAGADMVLGNHTHWVGGMEIYRGRPIVYSLANFVFSITRTEETREGILVEATFSGGRLVQLRIHPFFIVGGVQPNLLDPAGSGEVVMTQLFDASGALLPW